MDNSQKILSDVTIFNKYAKYIPQLGRRENWEDLCYRNMDMHLRKYPHMKAEIQQAYTLVESRKVLPSMRSMQFAGRPIELANNRMFNCAYVAADNPAVFWETMFLLLGGSGVGYSVQKQHVAELPVIVGPSDKQRRFLVGDSIEGWADAVKILVRAYFEGKSDPAFDFRDIRKKGAKLITSGGKAPGPDPLRICIDHLRSIMNGAIGRKLEPIEVHDMQCRIADAVLAGGIRRAAMIALFSEDDMDMLSCKSGAWWDLNPQRGRANNSVVLKRGTISKEDFTELWRIVERSNAGEPGMFWTNDYDIGTNPCISGDAIITVCDHGINGGLGVPYKIPMKMLVDVCNGQEMLPCALSLNTETGQKEWKQITAAAMTRKNTEVIKVTFNGKSVVCTPDHKIYTTNRGWVEAKDLEATDELVTLNP